MHTKFLDSLIIFLSGLCLFTIGLHSQEIISFEARFYLFALEVWRHGANWFPTTYQQPYPDYPGTSTYLIYLVSRLFGSLNKFTAVLPSAMASAMTLVITYCIGARYDRQWGWCAVFFLLFTMTFITEARTISLDQYVAMVTAWCFYIAFTDTRLSRSRESGNLVQRTGSLIEIPAFAGMTGSFLQILVLLIFSFAIRGPLGIVIPAGVLCVGYLCEKKYKKFLMVGSACTVLLIICSVILLKLAHQVGGDSFVQDVIRMQIGSRLQDNSQPPFFFYFTESFGGYAVTYPLAILVVLAALPKLINRNVSPEIHLLRKCIAWAVIIIVGLSIPGDKKMRYILPFAPALALICAYLFVSINPNRYMQVLQNIFKGLCFVFPLIAIVLLVYLHVKKTELGLHYPFLLIVFGLLQLAMLIWRKQNAVLLGLAAITFFIVNVGIVETINQTTNRTREFVSQMESLREKTHSPLIFFQEGSDGLPIKYLVNMSKEEIPVYLDSSNQLLRLSPHYYVLVGKENLPHISAEAMAQFEVVMRDKIGHDDVVVIEKK